MKRSVFGGQLVAVVLMLGILAGCASTPKEPAVDHGKAEADQAIAAAEAAIAKAKSNDWIWRDTEKFLKEAQDAAAKGDNDAAVSLANKARNQAEMAENQYYLEAAKIMFDEASAVQGLNASQQNALGEADKAIRNAEGRKAYDLLTPLLAEIRAASIQYEVVRGDSLWAISAKPEAYNNPYQWPLIFKGNRDQIKDADLIYPGQTFNVDRNPSASDVEAAVDHARNRGAWSIGVVEQSDRRYLGGSLELR
ncbi:MAG: LysM peptidoglycan-binding domain-containing protein [Pseudomonadota bacterium]|nr:LysM peptidoglycan-binding domain-containing protein [Pseudomonadota bacterium]